MNLKLKRSRVIYIVLIFAILSGTLRLTENGMTSLYRMVGPFVAVACLLSNYGKFKKPLTFFCVLLGYTIFTSVIFYSHISFDQLIFVVYIFVEFILIMTLKIKDKNFGENFFKFIDICAVITIAAAWLQLFTGYTLPFVEVSRGQPLGVYFSNGNELSAAMCGVLIIYVYQILFCNKKYVLHCILIIIITYLNDAKLSLIGSFVAIFVMSALRINQNHSFRVGDKSFFRLAILATVVLLLIVYEIDPVVSVRDYDISVNELFFDAVFGIISGKELGGANAIGSIHDRTSAIIFGMQELRKTYGFGIGLGNSIVMLQQPKYFLRSAKSMHNILFQFLAECGYFAIAVYAIIIKSAIKYFKSIHLHKINALKATFLVSFIFISSQSSVGILSNYFLTMVVIYIFLLDESFNFVGGNVRGSV